MAASNYRKRRLLSYPQTKDKWSELIRVAQMNDNALNSGINQLVNLLPSFTSGEIHIDASASVNVYLDGASNGFLFFSCGSQPNVYGICAYTSAGLFEISSGASVQVSSSLSTSRIEVYKDFSRNGVYFINNKPENITINYFLVR